MVINPKNYQKAFSWCIETAISFLFDVIDRNRHIDFDNVGNFFLGKIPATIPKTKVSKLVYELKRSGYIRRNSSNSVILTNKARIKIIDKISNSLTADGRYRVISFDIPEDKRVNGDNFRRAIKKIGFVQIQKSLWIVDKNIGTLVEDSIKEYGVEKYVAYFVVEATNIDEFIKNRLAKE